MSPSEAQRPWPDIAGYPVEDAAGRRHVLPIRVYFEDTDSQGALGFRGDAELHEEAKGQPGHTPLTGRGIYVPLFALGAIGKA
jgi:hypothetical protein